MESFSRPFRLQCLRQVWVARPSSLALLVVLAWANASLPQPAAKAAITYTPFGPNGEGGFVNGQSLLFGADVDVPDVYETDGQRTNAVANKAHEAFARDPVHRARFLFHLQPAQSVANCLPARNDLCLRAFIYHQLLGFKD